MNKLTKHLISILFFITACVTAGSVGAQSWTADGTPNPCVPEEGVISSGSNFRCACPQGWTYGFSNTFGENCTYSGIAGCWNPDNNGKGTCQACGYGGTIPLTVIFPVTACFGGSKGQQNWNGANPSTPVSGTPSCSSNYECVGYDNNATTGGYSSDIRLKRDIVLLGQTDKGIRLYSFKYLSSDQVYVGVMAQDLLENPKWQDAVITNPNGYYSVIYSKLGLEMVTLEQYQQVSAVALVK